MGVFSRRKFCNNSKAWDNWLSTVVSGRSSAEYIVLDEALGWGVWRMRCDESEVWMRGRFDSGAWEVQTRKGLSCCLL